MGVRQAQDACVTGRRPPARQPTTLDRFPAAKLVCRWEPTVEPNPNRAGRSLAQVSTKRSGTFTGPSGKVAEASGRIARPLGRITRPSGNLEPRLAQQLERLGTGDGRPHHCGERSGSWDGT